MQTERTRNLMKTAGGLLLTLLSLLLASAATVQAQSLLYVLRDVDGGENQIYGFRVNDTTGALAALTGFPLGTGGNGAFFTCSERLALDAANGRLYVINDSSDTLSAYAINPNTGALTALPFSPINLGTGSWFTLAVHPSGSPLVVGDSGGHCLGFQITATTATAAAGSPYSTGSAQPYSTVFSRNGNFVYTGGQFGSAIAGFSVNAATGVLTALAGSPFNAGAINAVAYVTDSAGRLFLSNIHDAQVRAFTTTAGIPSAVSGNPFSSGLNQGIHGVLHPNGFYLVADRSGSQVGVYQISGSGAATTLTAVAGSPFATGGLYTDVLALNQSGTFLFAANGNSRNLTSFSVNPTTGALTTLGTQPADTLGTTGLLTGMGYYQVNCANNPVVTNGNDSGAGSLRQAIADACAGSTITFQAGITTVTLTTAELLIDKNLTISGGGGVTVTRQNGSPNFRIFNVSAGTAAFNNLTISNGRLTGVTDGAGLLVAAGANLTCTACNVTGNYTDFAGGGFSNNGALMMNVCTIANNTASGSACGGLLRASATFNDCTFIGNGNTQGGALEIDGGTTTLTRCTFNANSSITNGIIFVNAASAVINATNCTVSGNTTATGIFDIGDGTANLLNCTFSGNTGAAQSVLVRNNTTAVLNLKNSLLTGSGTQLIRESPGVINSQGNNLLSDNSLPNPLSSDLLNTNPLLAPLGNYGGATQTHALLPGSPAINAITSSGAPTTDQRGINRVGNTDIGAFESRGFTLAITGGNNQTAVPTTAFANPLAVAVSSNFNEPVQGGQVTFTAPTSGPSAVLSNSAVTLPANGQASVTTTANALAGAYQVTAGGAGMNQIAFALNNFCVSNPVVTTTADNGAGSLRQVIAQACVGGTISFNLPANSKITLTSGELLIDKDLTIQGPGANLLTISGNQNSRVFYIPSGTVQLNGLTATGGNGVGSGINQVGGGIFNRGTLTLTNSAVFQNSTGTIPCGSPCGDGGGIFNDGTLTLLNSTVSYNRSPAFGGGIKHQFNNPLTITNSTISNNSSDDNGGGIYNTGPLTLTNVTITGNRAGFFGGGGLDNYNANVTLKNTLVAGNFRNLAQGTAPNDIAHALIAAAENTLIGDAATSGGITDGINGNIVGNNGTGARDLNTILNATLANNGGPTLTHRLLPGSPAINAGTSNGTPTTDQRSVARPQNGAVDIGAVEASFALAATSGTPQTTIPGTPFAAPLLATLTENGLPFADVPLTFSAPVNGASASFTGSTTVNTNAQGQASTNAVANLVQGSYAVQAAAPGLSPAAFALTNACPTLTLAPLPPATAGVMFNATLSANPAGGNYQFNSANLPTWLALTSNGTLSGTPPTAGSYTFNVVVTGFGVCTQTLPVTLTVVCPAITLAPATLSNAAVGTAYSQALSAAPGGTSYTFAVTQGQLPPGLTLSSNGLLSGTPTAPGNFSFAVTASGFGACTGTRAYNLLVTSVCAPITITPTTLTNGTTGTAYTATLSAAGSAGPYSFAIAAGSLPVGLSLSSAGLLSGTPSVSGTFNFTVTATGVGNCTGTQLYTLVITCPAISLTPSSLPSVTAGLSYNQTITASPAGVYSYSLASGTLPPGLNLNAATGTLTGLATATGTYNFTIKAERGMGCAATRSYSVSVSCPTITLNPTSLPNGSVSTAYNQSLSATPSGNYSFALSSGSLPAGLSLSTAGVLSGTPTASGTFTFTVRATAFGSCVGTRSFTLTITAACATITLPSLPNGTVSTNYYGDLSATTPSGSYSFSLDSGALPPGLALDNLFGALTGKPTAGGTYNFTLKATSNTNCAGTRAYGITITNSTAALAWQGDYDGDGQADLALWSAGDGLWRTQRSQTQQTITKGWGSAGDLTLLGDYDGDGLSDLAVFRPANATFYIQRSRDGQAFIKQWGLATDVPVPGDYDGDGLTDLAVWRGSNGGWYILRSSDQQAEVRLWGAAAAPYLDVPVPGDYDGDHRTDIAVFRRSSGTWLLQRSRDGQVITQAWGLGTDMPVAADYDGDGQTDLAVWRGATGQWFVLQSADQQYRVMVWGAAAAGDVPVVGDFDGDGLSDLAVWRAPAGRWYIQPSTTATPLIVPQANANDQPILSPGRVGLR